MDIEWFKDRKRELKITDLGMAEALGVDRSVANRVINGKVRMDYRRINAVAALFRVSREEILARAGLTADTAPAMPSDQPPIRDASAEDGAIAIRRVDLSYAMGDGSSLEDYPEEEAVLYDPGFLRRITKAPPARLFVATGDGDSMFPTLINDDEVVIDTTQRTLNMQDRIWACAYQGAGMIKRLRIVGEGKVEIRSDNRTVGDQVVDVAELVIVGRVIYVGRRV
jgi:phage repressor protein C with HTH and peptisase S24 domain